jgi:hypothetical protein
MDGDSAKVGWIFGQSLKVAAQPLENKGSMSGVLLRVLEELVPVRVRTEIKRLSSIFRRQVRILFHHETAYRVSRLFRSRPELLLLAGYEQAEYEHRNKSDDQPLFVHFPKTCS